MGDGSELVRTALEAAGLPVQVRLDMTLTTYRKWQKQLLTGFFSPSVPVSRPVLTVTPPGSRAPEGDEMTLHCEAQRGSLPILYQFFHEDVLLKKIKVTSQRESSFRFSLTTEHSGSYYCTANNGLRSQRSEAVTLSVYGKTRAASLPALPLHQPLQKCAPPSSFLLFFLLGPT